jgi:iron transport multicopper oxidase
VFAVLRYDGAPNAEPTTKADSGGGGTLLKEQNLKVTSERIYTARHTETPSNCRLLTYRFLVEVRLRTVSSISISPSPRILPGVWRFAHSSCHDLQSLIYFVNYSQWTINGIQYLPPSLPTLLNIIAHNFTTESDFTTSEHTFVLNRDQVIELNIHGSLNGITHPL